MQTIDQLRTAHSEVSELLRKANAVANLLEGQARLEIEEAMIDIQAAGSIILATARDASAARDSIN